MAMGMWVVLAACDAGSSAHPAGLVDPGTTDPRTDGFETLVDSSVVGRDRWNHVVLAERLAWASGIVGALGSWWRLSDLTDAEAELTALHDDLDERLRRIGIRVPEPDPGRVVTVETELEDRYDVLLARGRESRSEARHVARAAVDTVRAWIDTDLRVGSPGAASRERILAELTRIRQMVSG